MVVTRHAFRTHLLAMLLGVSILGSSMAQTVPITAKEPQLRAAVILGIIRFTRWPQRQKPENSHLSICTIGRPTSESALLLVSENRKVAEHSISIQTLGNSSRNISACDVVVFGPDLARDTYINTHQRLVSLPVLTICDNCSQDEPETMVRLVRRDNRIGFEIDMAHARSQGIVFSSSLLELALEVRR